MSSDPSLYRRGFRQPGFTLVEMVSAMVVLAVLGLIIAQAFLAASKVLAGSNKDTDSYSDMRQALDRIGLDLAARIKREDVPIYFKKNIGNDTFSFYSSVASTLVSGSPRGLSQLFYQVGTTGSNAYSLQRASEGVLWAGGGTAPLIFVDPASTLVDPGLPTATDFDTLAPSVFRMEVSFIAAPSSSGNNIVNTFPTTSRTWQNGVGSICVTLAALDGDSRKLLSAPSTQMANLALKLADATDGQDTLGTWNAVVQNSSALATAAGVPPLVANRVRVMERFFPVN